jgi:hypothetical protein
MGKFTPAIKRDGMPLTKRLATLEGVAPKTSVKTKVSWLMGVPSSC